MFSWVLKMIRLKKKNSSLSPSWLLWSSYGDIVFNMGVGSFTKSTRLLKQYMYNWN